MIRTFVVFCLTVAFLGVVPDLHAAILQPVLLRDFAEAVLPHLEPATIPAVAMAAVAASVEPIFVSVAAAAEILATSRSEIYQKLARGELDAVKDGVRTKISYESIKRAAAALPKANIKLYVPRVREEAERASKRKL
jgi:excisionase family DNA binding protein